MHVHEAAAPVAAQCPPFLHGFLSQPVGLSQLTPFQPVEHVHADFVVDPALGVCACVGHLIQVWLPGCDFHVFLGHISHLDGCPKYPALHGDRLQSSPCVPFGQAQWCVLPVAVHVPPFLHGLLSHPVEWSHLDPSQPPLHVQDADLPSFVRLHAPWAHVTLAHGSVSQLSPL